MPSSRDFCKFSTETHYCAAQGGHTGDHQLYAKLYAGPGEPTSNAIVPPTIQHHSGKGEEPAIAAGATTNYERLAVMLYRSLERLSLAIEACGRIGFEESKPTTNAAHGAIWIDLNDAQKDAKLKLKHYEQFVRALLSAPPAPPAEPSEEMRRLGVHLSHCNFGEQPNACKYGEDDCPALTEDWSWFGKWLQRADKLLRAAPTEPAPAGSEPSELDYLQAKELAREWYANQWDNNVALVEMVASTLAKARASAAPVRVREEQLRKALEVVIGERDTELDMMSCQYPRGSSENKAWHDGVFAVWKRLEIVKADARRALADAPKGTSLEPSGGQHES